MPYLSIASRSTPGAEGEALPLVGIETAGGDDLGVDHAAAQHLHPAFRPADDAAALFHRPADVDLGAEGSVNGK